MFCEARAYQSILKKQKDNKGGILRQKKELSDGVL